MSVLVAGAVVLFLTAKKIFDYSAAPLKAKGSDFVFPPNPVQENPAVLVSEPDSSPITFKQRGGFTNDASHLNKTAVFGIVDVRSEDDVRNAIQFARENQLKLTCAGQQHSMGGQSFTHGGIILDCGISTKSRDKENKIANIQRGARWWQVQKRLDKQGLSVKSMQSINIFSVGGTLSVNAHVNRSDAGPGRSNGSFATRDAQQRRNRKGQPEENAELFRHVLGGYGLFGVILDVDLGIVPNQMYARKAQYLDYTEYPSYYRNNVESNPNIGLVFGRLSVAPQSYLRETAIHTYEKAPYDQRFLPCHRRR